MELDLSKGNVDRIKTLPLEERKGLYLDSMRRIGANYDKGVSALLERLATTVVKLHSNLSSDEHKVALKEYEELYLDIIFKHEADLFDLSYGTMLLHFKPELQPAIDALNEVLYAKPEVSTFQH